MTDVPNGLAQQGLMGIRLGNRIHLFYQGNHFAYDPATDTYETKASVPTPRTWSTAAVVDGKIYLIGGYSYGSPSGASDANEVYDPGHGYVGHTSSHAGQQVWGDSRKSGYRQQDLRYAWPGRRLSYRQFYLRHCQQYVVPGFRWPASTRWCTVGGIGWQALCDRRAQ